jgi:gamma-glutamylcyclotransferase (GGCT)/AIG2-like uncharacterized protein YtfP
MNPPDQLFVYGTLRKAANHLMYSVIDRYSTFVGEASIIGELYDLGPYPGVLVPDQCQDRVIGELYRLNESDAIQALRELDQYEGCAESDPQPHLYQRQSVRVMLTDGTESEAWVYTMRALPAKAVRVPSGDYLAWRQGK